MHEPGGVSDPSGAWRTCSPSIRLDHAKENRCSTMYLSFLFFCAYNFTRETQSGLTEWLSELRLPSIWAQYVSISATFLLLLHHCALMHAKCILLPRATWTIFQYRNLKDIRSVVLIASNYNQNNIIAEGKWFYDNKMKIYCNINMFLKQMLVI